MPTPFQSRVHEALNKIPQGRVTTYGLLAKYLKTGAVRAVATAVGKNPDYPQVPCHRVVCADGRVGKYSGIGGVSGKIKLLKNEGVLIERGKVVDFKHKIYSF